MNTIITKSSFTLSQKWIPLLIFWLFSYAAWGSSMQLISDSTGTVELNLAGKVLQGSDIYIPKKGYFFKLTGGISYLENSALDSYKQLTGMNQPGMGLYAGYFIKPVGSPVRIQAGIGISTFSNILKTDLLLLEYEANDVDDDTYTETLALYNFEENTKLLYLSMPVQFEIGQISSSQLGYYVNLGGKFSYLLSSKTILENNPTYTTSGFYGQYHANLYDIPELGFYDQKPLEKSNDGFSPFRVSLTAGAGISFHLVEELVVMKIGAEFDYGLNNLSAKENDSFQQNFRNQFVSNRNVLVANPTDKLDSYYFGLDIQIYYVLANY